MESEYGELVPWTPSYKSLPKPPKKRGRPTNAALGLPPPAPKPTAEDMRQQCRVEFRAALDEWIRHPDSTVESLTEVGENAYLCKLLGNRRTIPTSAVKRLALLLPGQIGALPDNQGIIWQRGGGGTRGWLLTSKGRVEECQAAHRILLDTVPAAERRWTLLPFTQGAIAGKFLQWVDAKQYPTRAHEAILAHPDGFAHRRAIPGHYSAPHVYWDVVAYYYNLITRLPSPIIYPTADGFVGYQQLDGQQQERWDASLAAIGSHKSLRNSLFGKMMGSAKPLINYSRKHPDGFASNSSYGTNRAAALLVGRLGHELTQLESIGGESVWSHTDCVVLPEGIEPTVWRSHGFQVERKAVGETVVVDLMSYKVGAREKGAIKMYLHGGIEMQEAEEGARQVVTGTTFPEVQFHRAWLSPTLS